MRRKAASAVLPLRVSWTRGVATQFPQLPVEGSGAVQGGGIVMGDQGQSPEPFGVGGQVAAQDDGGVPVARVGIET